jgi:peptidoglycan/LPS O-acetylase OafA/YrhL
VSVFFTLSGFLITSLLLREHAATGTIDVTAFYSRRIRRLLPASVMTLGIVVVVAATTDVFDGVASLRDHVLGSLFQVANWVLLAGSGSYQDLLNDTSGTPSPLEHFWSLAIEEQFYWVWPVAMLLLLPRVAGRRSRIMSIGGLTLAAAIAAPVIAQVWGPDAAYWATPARLSEILVGALLAVLIDGRAIDRRLAALAPLAAVGLGAAVVLFPASSGPAYEGALPLVAIVSGALLLGLQVEGPVQRALAIAPLAALGRISYGVYLFHWPIYVVLDEQRLGTGGAVLTLARMGLTLVLAIASYALVEQPIRRAKRRRFVPTLGASAMALTGVAVLALVLVPASAGDYWNVDDDVADAAAIQVADADTPLALVDPATTAPTTAPPTTSPSPSVVSSVPDDTAAPTTSTSTVPASTAPPTLPPLPELARPVRIVVTGDSTANALGTGVIRWAAAHPELAQAEVEGAAGCGIVTGGDRRRGDTTQSDETCVGWVESELIPVVKRAKPDVVAVMVTTWDVIGRKWTTDDLLAPSDPEYHEHIESAYAAFVDEVAAAGVPHIVFIRQPVPDVWWLPVVQEEDQPERHAVIYAVYDELARANPGLVSVVDFDRWFSEQGFDRDEDIRPDGVHLAPEAAEMVTDEYLGERLIRAALGLDVAG